MPTYEYACRECGEHTEAQQSFSDPALTECPACGGPLRKVFGNIAITFKGSGFYKTDSRSANGKAKAGAAKTAEGSGASSSDGGSSESSSSTSSTDGGGTKPAETTKPSEKSSEKSTGKSSSTPPAAAAS